MGSDVAPARPGADIIVIFGASGDLTKRKLIPAIYELYAAGLVADRVGIIGCSRHPRTSPEFRTSAREAIVTAARVEPDGETSRRFLDRLSYVRVDYEHAGGLHDLAIELGRWRERVGPDANPLFYCATPPEAYGAIVRRIAEEKLQVDARIVVEKPFGSDLSSSIELDRRLRDVFDESQIFRIDHYLGKETVQSILTFRFANGIFEPIWNRRYIDHVQISVVESIGIEGRGRFYERTGAVRDMVSTHLFQMMTFVAMEPPVSFEPDRVRDETVKVLRAATRCEASNLVRGQYEGYRSEPGVDPASTTETFAALRVDIDNWRWSGVPFFLRTGKALKGKVSEITLKFRQVPLNVFRGTSIDYLPKRNQLTFRVQPDEGISIAMNSKRPGPSMSLGRVRLDFDYEHAVADSYELLLLEAMRGDQTLFLRRDAVEEAWAMLEPILAAPGTPTPYAAGSWGPKEADDLIHPSTWYLSADDGADDARSRSSVAISRSDLLP